MSLALTTPVLMDFVPNVNGLKLTMRMNGDEHTPHDLNPEDADETTDNQNLLKALPETEAEDLPETAVLADPGEVYIEELIKRKNENTPPFGTKIITISNAIFGSEDTDPKWDCWDRLDWIVGTEYDKDMTEYDADRIKRYRYIPVPIVTNASLGSMSEDELVLYHCTPDIENDFIFESIKNHDAQEGATDGMVWTSSNPEWTFGECVHRYEIVVPKTAVNFLALIAMDNDFNSHDTRRRVLSSRIAKHSSSRIANDFKKNEAYATFVLPPFKFKYDESFSKEFSESSRMKAIDKAIQRSFRYVPRKVSRIILLETLDTNVAKSWNYVATQKDVLQVQNYDFDKISRMDEYSKF